jgi:purine-binding chemotaxis protein CheW
MNMMSDAAVVARHDAGRAALPESGEFLTFRLGGEEYGIDILNVQEIRSYEQPTRIPDAPTFVKGVVNLRGAIVPIIDLRLRLGSLNEQGSADCSARTVVIMLNIKGRVVGAVVDSVSDVLELPTDAIKPAPEMASAADACFVTGIGCVKSGGAQRVLVLMDIEALLENPETGHLPWARSHP